MKFDPWKLARLVAVPLLFAAGVLSAPYVPNWKPAPAPAPAPAISLEPQYKCSAGYIVRVTAATKGKTVKWRVISGPDAMPSLQVVDAHTVDFASPLAGKFVLQASTSVSGESESADTEILNGSQPGPTPPDPPKPPDPPAPSVGPLKVLMVYDGDPIKRAKYTAGQRAVLDSTKITTYLNAHCAKGADGKTPEWRCWPDNADARNESSVWQGVLARPRKGLPWVVISNGTPTGYEGPLPSNVDEMLRLLQQYGGP